MGLASYPWIDRSAPHLLLHLLIVHLCRDCLQCIYLVLRVVFPALQLPFITDGEASLSEVISDLVLI